MTFKEHYSNQVFEKIDLHRQDNANSIFVVQGQSTLLDDSLQRAEIVAPDTFCSEKDGAFWGETWCSKVFETLNESKDYHLMSFAQFSYLLACADCSSLVRRVVLLVDNLRHIFPLDEQYYMETEGRDMMELRPKQLPLHQAEQLAINGNYYYSLKTVLPLFRIVPLYDDSKKLDCSDNSELAGIDVNSDPLSLDMFINECIRQDNFNKQIAVKLYNKQVLNPSITNSLEKLNALMQLFGGNLFVREESSIATGYSVRPHTQALLNKYWGEQAAFRNLSVYKNPNDGNEMTDISQGLIVETIISEYENAVGHADYRDLFLTSPTGSG